MSKYDKKSHFQNKMGNIVQRSKITVVPECSTSFNHEVQCMTCLASLTVSVKPISFSELSPNEKKAIRGWYDALMAFRKSSIEYYDLKASLPSFAFVHLHNVIQISHKILKCSYCDDNGRTSDNTIGSTLVPVFIKNDLTEVASVKSFLIDKTPFMFYPCGCFGKENRFSHACGCPLNFLICECEFGF